MTHEVARALCEAGYMPLVEYIRLCELHGWVRLEQSGSGK